MRIAVPLSVASRPSALALRNTTATPAATPAAASAAATCAAAASAVAASAAAGALPPPPPVCRLLCVPLTPRRRGWQVGGAGAAVLYPPLIQRTTLVGGIGGADGNGDGDDASEVDARGRAPCSRVLGPRQTFNNNSTDSNNNSSGQQQQFSGGS